VSATETADSDASISESLSELSSDYSY
jgi:hypothetical protein